MNPATQEIDKIIADYLIAVETGEEADLNCQKTNEQRSSFATCRVLSSEKFAKRWTRLQMQWFRY